jgi:predicted phage terminase large subunit-like protein
LFPEIDIKQDKDTKGNYRVIKREFASKGRVPRILTGGNRLSTSVGGAATGFHAHIIIWDDPLDPRRAASPVEITNANRWMDHTLPFRKVNKSVTFTLGIMQRLHQIDPTGYLLKKRTNITNICLPGEINTQKYREKVSPPELIKRYRFGLLDPNRLDQLALNDFLKLGQFIYGSQIGQDPIPLGGGMFVTDKMPTIDRPPAEVLIKRQVRYWDKAGSVNKGAYTVGVKMAELHDGTFVVMDVRRGQWGSAKREEIMKTVAHADAMVNNRNLEPHIFIEQEPGSGGKESAESTIKNLVGFVVKADRPTGDKVYRADPYSVQVNNGNVAIVKAAWNEEYIDELSNFPNSTYKDQVDASSGAFSQLSGRKQVKIGR